jgi:hypothetical protein
MCSPGAAKGGALANGFADVAGGGSVDDGLGHAANTIKIKRRIDTAAG